MSKNGEKREEPCKKKKKKKLWADCAEHWNGSKFPAALRAGMTHWSFERVGGTHPSWFSPADGGALWPYTLTAVSIIYWILMMTPGRLIGPHPDPSYCISLRYSIVKASHFAAEQKEKSWAIRVASGGAALFHSGNATLSKEASSSWPGRNKLSTVCYLVPFFFFFLQKAYRHALP